MQLRQHRCLHRVRGEISRLEGRHHPDAMRAALTGAGIMLRARRRVLVRLDRTVGPVVAVMCGVGDVRLAASGNHGEYRRQRREDHAQGHQKRQRMLDGECTNHASNFSRCRFPEK